jgi:hypothetical protein
VLCWKSLVYIDILPLSMLPTVMQDCVIPASFYLACGCFAIVVKPSDINDREGPKQGKSSQQCLAETGYPV